MNLLAFRRNHRITYLPVLTVVLLAVLPRYKAFVFHHHAHCFASQSISHATVARTTPSLTAPTRAATTTRQNSGTAAATTTATTTTALSLSILPHDLYLALHSTHAPDDSSSSSTLNVLQAYGTLLNMYPLTTKAVTAAILAFSGDAIAQYSTIWRQQREQNKQDGTLSSSTAATDNNNNNNDSTSRSQQYDLTRGLTFLCFGAVYTGAFQHYWFTYLTQHIDDWGTIAHIWGPTHVDLPVDAVVDSKEWWSYFDLVSQLEQPPSDALLAAAKVVVNQFGVIPTIYMPLFFFVTGNFDIQRAWTRAQSLYFKLLRRNYVYWLPVQFAQFFLLPPEWQIPFVSAASLIWTVILSSIATSSSSTATEATVNAQQQQQQQHQQQPQLVQPILETIGSLPSKQQQVAKNIGSDQADKNETTKPVTARILAESEAARDITEQVSLEDVRQALAVPESVGSAATGLTLGLVASAADDAALGTAVGSIVGAQADLGVAVTAAVGAGVFLLGAMQDSQEKNQEEEADEGEAIVDDRENISVDAASDANKDTPLDDKLNFVSDKVCDESIMKETEKEIVSEKR